MKVYLDNAATTAIDEKVIEVMTSVMKNQFGNPSSIHSYGREARSVIEKSRKQIAEILGTSPAELFFTSCGTEANNMVLRKAVHSLGVKHIITSPIEHHAITHTAEELDRNGVRVSWVKIDAQGHVDMNDLARLLEEPGPTLVSLMHANNEIGTVTDIVAVGNLCREKGAYFHSDTVQTMAHFAFDIKSMPIDFLTCSAHKFHGPKGIGMLYINSRVKLDPFITGGAQERNMRAGTENIYGIAGLAKALELAYADIEEHAAYIQGLKSYMAEQLMELIPGVEFNGDIRPGNLFTVLNVRFPETPDAEMFLMKLDIHGIAASGGSACASGSNVGSHVLAALQVPENRPSVRFSFSRFTTREEVDYTLGVLQQIWQARTVSAE